MAPDIRLHQIARLSLLSVLVTTAAITIHHAYLLGPGALALGAALAAASTGSLWWFRQSRRQAPRIAYLLVNAWIVVGFGLMKGLWDVTYRIFLATWLSTLSTAFPKPTIGAPTFELSGVAMFVGSLFVLYYGVQFFRATKMRASSRAPSGRPALVLAGTAALALAATAGLYADGRRDRWVPPSQGVVRIGVIVPTTGPYALLGNSFVKAVQMAQADLAGTKYRYELVIRDSGPDPSKARPIIEHAIAEDRLDAIVGGISIIGQVTQPLAARARLPHICVCTVTSIGDGAYNFTNIPSPEAEGALWVQEARRRGIARVAIVAQDYPSINNHVKAMKAAASAAGLTIVSEQPFPEGVTDFRPRIAAAAAAHPDVYYIEALSPGLDLLAQQLADANIHNLSSVVAPSLSGQPRLFEGAWYTDSNLRDIAFRKRFEDKYPGTQFATHMMPYAYDSVHMIVAAYEHGQNPAVYLRNLRSYEGTADTLIKPVGSGNFQSKPAVWVIANGKPALFR